MGFGSDIATNMQVDIAANHHRPPLLSWRLLLLIDITATNIMEIIANGRASSNEGNATIDVLLR